MTNKQQEAVRLIRAIADCVQTHPQLSEDEPGGYCTEADQLMDEAATLLQAWSVDIERKDALLRQALTLCQWISETQHTRGSVNGLAAQIRYAAEQEISQ